MIDCSSKLPGPAVLHPIGAVELGVAELDGIGGVGALGDEAFVKFGGPLAIELLHVAPLLVEGEPCLGGGFSELGLLQEIDVVGLGAFAEGQDRPAVLDRK